MRIIEKTESPMHFQGHRTFDNTFWEPNHEASLCPASSRNSSQTLIICHWVLSLMLQFACGKLSLMLHTCAVRELLLACLS